MLKKWVVLGLFLLAPAAFAKEGAKADVADVKAGAKSYSMLGGFVANPGQGIFQVGIGQPGLEAKFVYGVASKLDVGGLLALNWGEGVDFVLRVQIPIRIALYGSGKLGVSFGLTPGVAILFGGEGGTAVNIPVHLDLTSGFRVTDELSVMAGFEVPLELWTKGRFNALIPLVAATGLEYHVASQTKLWTRLRAGHAFSARKGMELGEYFSCHVGVAVAF